MLTLPHCVVSDGRFNELIFLNFKSVLVCIFNVFSFFLAAQYCWQCHIITTYCRPIINAAVRALMRLVVLLCVAYCCVLLYIEQNK